MRSKGTGFFSDLKRRFQATLSTLFGKEDSDALEQKMFHGRMMSSMRRAGNSIRHFRFEVNGKTYDAETLANFYDKAALAVDAAATELLVLAECYLQSIDPTFLYLRKVPSYSGVVALVFEVEKQLGQEKGAAFSENFRSRIGHEAKEEFDNARGGHEESPP